MAATTELVAGADACRIGKRKGWAVVELGGDQAIDVRFVQDLAVYLDRTAPKILCIDIPIGLPKKGEKRQADLEARLLVGPLFRSVFLLRRVKS